MPEVNSCIPLSKEDMISIRRKLRQNLPPRSALTRKYEWDEEQYNMIVHIAKCMKYVKKYPFSDPPGLRQKGRTRETWLYPRGVKGITGNTVYYVLRCANYLPLFAFLYDTVNMRTETAEKNAGYLMVQQVFAINEEFRPEDLEYISKGPELAHNILDWILRRLKKLEETGAIKIEDSPVMISEYFTEENAPHNNGYWIEAFYSAEGMLVKEPRHIISRETGGK